VATSSIHRCGAEGTSLRDDALTRGRADRSWRHGKVREQRGELVGYEDRPLLERRTIRSESVTEEVVARVDRSQHLASVHRRAQSVRRSDRYNRDVELVFEFDLDVGRRVVKRKDLVALVGVEALGDRRRLIEDRRLAARQADTDLWLNYDKPHPLRCKLIHDPNNRLCKVSVDARRVTEEVRVRVHPGRDDAANTLRGRVAKLLRRSCLNVAVAELIVKDSEGSWGEGPLRSNRVTLEVAYREAELRGDRRRRSTVRRRRADGHERATGRRKKQQGGLFPRPGARASQQSAPF